MLQVTSLFKNAIYAPIRKIIARMKFTLDGVTTTYGNEYLIKVNILEEMSITNDFLSSNIATIIIDNTNGSFSFLTLSDVDLIINKRPKIELEFALEITPGNYEWIKMGTYFLSEWKNDIGSLTVTLIGKDNFDMLKETSYNSLVTLTLYNHAVAILTGAGITDYELDDDLNDLSGAFVEILDSRTALQYIGIASKSVVSQNREGKIRIKLTSKLDDGIIYHTYSGGLYAGAASYMVIDSGYTIKNINYDNQYNPPSVTLDRQAYEVVVSVYDPTKREIIVINPDVTAGQSLKLDNPLINTEAQAIDVANWIISASKNVAKYSTTWRQNPALECGDKILVQDNFDSDKNTRIIKQEFEYVGYLNGKTESKGGV